MVMLLYRMRMRTGTAYSYSLKKYILAKWLLSYVGVRCRVKVHCEKLLLKQLLKQLLLKQGRRRHKAAIKEVVRLF